MKYIKLTKTEYSYQLLWQSEFVPYAKRMIIESQRTLDCLNGLLNIAKLI